MEYVEIDKIINVELGKTPSRNNSDYWNGKHTWIAISDMNKKYIVNSKEKITNEAIENTKIKKVPKDTVIMSFKLSIGKRAITKSEVYTNEAIAAFHIKDLKYLIPEYLYYALESVDFLKYTDKAVKGKTLNKEKLKKIKIPIFPLTEQLKISEILNKTQKIIEDKKKQIFLFDELIKSRFIEMFGDPIKNDKGWEVKKLGEITNKIGDGLHGTPKYDINGSIPFINGNNLTEGKIVIQENTKFVNKVEYKKYFKEISINTVFLSINGTLGRLAFYNNERIVLGKSVCFIDLKKDINKIFIYYLLKNKKVIYELEQNSTKSTIKNISLKYVRNFNTILPPCSLQNIFAEFVTRIDKLKFEAEKSLKEMENLYDSLMQKFFKQ
ncbi:restriction endonuclease subunit S [Leptotrichia trevisanii]|uniref:Restriction endonuclease S subunit n=1 Tax=Leptotrichia trevisanii TaxID=109328 RepID=A0A510JZ50_9FUSO|nr:restriction endonuclease subunit S [Leptotrichia trevisanii]BBM44670.1 restriction endonuclease S subunit [Leptotrichia trevisanii]